MIISTILENTFKKDKLNILTAPTHEAYQTLLSKVPNITHWLLQNKNFKSWDHRFRSLPYNHILINEIPLHVNFDYIISQNKAGQMQYFMDISRRRNIPLISVEHTVHYDWPNHVVEYYRNLKGDINIFISEWSAKKWGYKEGEYKVIEHGIDTNIFRPIDIDRKQYILTTVNQYSKEVRWVPCGWPLYKEVTENLPKLNVGDDEPHSKPAKSIEELVKYHNEAYVFLNTAKYSPIPMSLLEAMSSGMICVSLNACMVPEIIKHEYNGFLADNAKDMRKILIEVLTNNSKYDYIRENARKTILERFALNRFINDWKSLLYT